MSGQSTRTGWETPKSIQKIIDNTQINCITMCHSLASEPLDFTQTKLGGVGYLPVGESHPKNDHGELLLLLFQINFSELSKGLSSEVALPHQLPKSGLLQIYIDGRAPQYGADNSCTGNPYATQHYQTRFWKDCDAKVNAKALAEYSLFLDNDTRRTSIKNRYCSPIPTNKEFSYVFGAKKQSASLDSIEYQNLDTRVKMPPIVDFIAEVEADEEQIQEWRFFEQDLGLDYPDNVLSSYFYDNLANLGGSHVLGYPNFNQDDPRKYDHNIKDYILLFQLDSDMHSGIMWGDLGAAYFFISPQDLQNEDFSRLTYFWDCG